MSPVPPKKKLTPAQRFALIFTQWTRGAIPEDRANGERHADACLKRMGKTRADIPELLVQAQADDKAANPPPPPSDPRVDESVRYDPKRHSVANLVEGLLKTYVTMSEHVRTIYSLAICLTHVYTRFAIAPRIVLASKRPGCGKSNSLEIARRLVFRGNEEATGTAAALEDHFVPVPCALLLDENEHHESSAMRRIQRIWNLGHRKGSSSKFSKMVGGKKQVTSFYAIVFLAGVSKGIGRLLAAQQQSRTFKLWMQKYTAETKPPRDFNIEEEVDVDAFRAVYTLLRRWAEEVKLDPRPVMPAGIIGRDADNIRGLLAVADACGGEWPRRAREALMALLEQQRAEDPVLVILRHGVIIGETLEVDRIKSTQLNTELRKLDLSDWDWNRYQGLGGSDPPHPLTIGEQAELLRGEDGFPGIVSRPMRLRPGGKQFRGYEFSWFSAALREYEAKHEHEPSPTAPHLRLAQA